MEATELQIIAACQKGELENFGLLYDLYIRKIYDFIFYRTNHRETAEDLTSITFTKALEQMQSFNAKKGSFSAWLYRIARNTVIDHYRTNKPASDIESAFNLAGPTDVERQAEAAVNLQKVQAYLKTLPQETQDVVLMRVWDGLSYKEIAEILGKSEGACKMLFSRTMDKLHKEVAFALLYLLILKI